MPARAGAATERSGSSTGLPRVFASGGDEKKPPRGRLGTFWEPELAEGASAIVRIAVPMRFGTHIAQSCF